MDCTASNTSDNHTQDNILNGLSLYEACRTNNVDVVRQALLQGVSVNFSYKKSFPPLYVSAKYCHTEIISLLLKHKADVNVKNMFGNTPLHIATERGHTEIVSLLVSNNADVNRTNRLGLTPLHLSSRHDHTEIVSLLLANKADINARCLEALTSLHYAAKFGKERTIDYLLQHGAVLDNLSLTRRIGFWWKKLSLRQSTTTSVSLTLRPDNAGDMNEESRILGKTATDIEECLRAAGRDVETTSDPTPSYETFTLSNLSETVSTSESGQALARAIAGRMTQCVTECLKEFPSVYSTCQPEISTHVSSTQQNGTPIVNINITSVVNINNEIAIQEGKDVKCQKAKIKRPKFVSVGGSINVVNSSREASIDNEDIDESNDEAEQ